MKIYRELSQTNGSNEQSAITIGYFDGLHLGHQAVLKQLSTCAKSSNLQSTVITFSNHPLEVLRPELPLTNIYSIPHKLKLLEKMGIDQVILLPFTKDLAALTASEFLTKVRDIHPFSHLILGYDARFGKNNSGDRPFIENYASHNQIQAEYISPYRVGETVISSSKIRNWILQGELMAAEQFLSRPFSYYTIAKPVIELIGLCTPPQGNYSVKIIVENEEEKELSGVARIGSGYLQVQPFQEFEKLHGKNIEIVVTSKQD